MPLNINPLTTDDLTQAIPDGTGVFDTLMRAAKGHLEQEYDQNRIRAADYSQVYLGAMTAILQNSVGFLLQKDKASQDALLIQEQIKLAVLQQELLQKQIEQADKDSALKAAQTLKVNQETHNLVNADLQTIAQTETIKQQKLNLITENVTMVKQQAKLDADTDLVKQNTLNAVTEGTNLEKQGCLLAAQYDLAMLNKLQTTAQTTLIQQKTATEKAQTVATGVDDNSVVGKQKLLYAAQTDGFKRDAEQKAAKILVDTWNVRRTTDDATVADSNNLLNDVTIGRTITKLLTGVGA